MKNVVSKHTAKLGERAVIRPPDWLALLPDNAFVDMADLADANGVAYSTIARHVQDGWLPPAHKLCLTRQESPWNFNDKPRKKGWLAKELRAYFNNQ